MKRTVILATAIALVSFSACNNDSAKNEHEGHDMDNQQKESPAACIHLGTEIRIFDFLYFTNPHRALIVVRHGTVIVVNRTSASKILYQQIQHFAERRKVITLQLNVAGVFGDSRSIHF